MIAFDANQARVVPSSSPVGSRRPSVVGASLARALYNKVYLYTI